MIKLLLYLFLSLAAFVGAVAASLAFTGNLSTETLNKLIHPAPVIEEAPPPRPPDEADALVRALQQREQDLNQREAQLREDEDRLKKTQADLEELRNQLVELEAKVGQAVKIEDAAQQQRILDVAQSLGKMRPISAAKTLNTWSVEDVGRVLRQIKEKDRGKILDAMEPEKASAVLLYLQTPKI